MTVTDTSNVPLQGNFDEFGYGWREAPEVIADEVLFNVDYTKCGICSIELELHNLFFERVFEYGTFFSAVCYQLDSNGQTLSGAPGMAFMGQVGVIDEGGEEDTTRLFEYYFGPITLDDMRLYGRNLEDSIELDLQSNFMINFHEDEENIFT